MIDRYALRPTLWQGLTLRDLISAATVEAPAAGLITDIGLDGRRLHLTARALDHIANRVARRFATAGAQKGDTILIALPNGAPAIIALLGALGAGLTPCLVAPTLDDDALALALRRVKPRAIVSASFPQFDPLSRCVTTARRLAMPLYLWNFGPVDHDHAAPLYDLLSGDAPARLLRMHPPNAGDADIMTLWDRGDGPEPVRHQQAALLAQAVLARLAQPIASTRIVSALSLTTQAGLVLGPLRALLTRTPLTLIADPSSESFHKAATDGPADYVVPPRLADALLAEPSIKTEAVLLVQRAGQDQPRMSGNSFIAFGEAMTLPAAHRGQALQPGTITASTTDGLLHFADLKTNLKGSFTLASPLADCLSDGSVACPSLDASLGRDGEFINFTPKQRGHNEHTPID